MEMFDEIRVVSPKRSVADEFKEACDAFIAAEKRFNKINLTVRLHETADTSEWWDSLEGRYLCEKRVWELFTAGERSPHMGRMYLGFRDALLHGKSLRADA